MNRKIAAIFAADVAGYSTLVADDEEEALRRLTSYREVIDDFIAQFGGKIFNTAGDSVMAAFPSAVEAVRCSIDIQESLRTRNRAYPESRHMLFRIGINIGDVVERNGDLLGDGVNLAARVQALAVPGGICISRSVHEQVVGKLSVGFDDLGQQRVKNIPTPVQVFSVAWRQDAPVRGRTGQASSAWLATGVALALVAAVAGYVVVRGRTTSLATAPVAQAVALQPTVAPPESPVPVVAQPTLPVAQPPVLAGTPLPAPALPAPVLPTPGVVPVALPARRAFVPEAIPFLTRRDHQDIAAQYAASTGFKAIALNRTRHGYALGAATAEAAKALALQRCDARSKAAGYKTPCEIYAVGNQVVWPYATPPVPPRPWVRRDAATEQPLTVDLLRRLHPSVTERNVADHLASKSSKYIALLPLPGGGAMDYYKAMSVSDEEAMRVVLELCGHASQEACIIAVAGDTLVVPVPMTRTVVGLFRPATHPAVSQAQREPLAQSLAGAPGGWTAVAIGASGQPAAAFGHDTEEQAISAAMDDCKRRDRDCKVIAVGPFAVEPSPN